MGSHTSYKAAPRKAAKSQSQFEPYVLVKEIPPNPLFLTDSQTYCLTAQSPAASVWFEIWGQKHFLIFL